MFRASHSHQHHSPKHQNSESPYFHQQLPTSTEGVANKDLEDVNRNEKNTFADGGVPKIVGDAKIQELFADKEQFLNRRIGTLDNNSLVDLARSKFAKRKYFIPFVALSFMTALVEPIIVGFEPTTELMTTQIAILAISTVLFLLGLHFTISEVHDLTLTYFEKITEVFDGEVVLELVCLLIGWVCITQSPGLAAIRCFRVLRYFWYFELIITENAPDYDPAEHIFSPTKAVQLCLLYMEALGAEFFSAKSRGAVVILAIFFYLTYIFGVIFWLEVPTLMTGAGDSCGTLTSCFIVCMRLAFYDGTGLDFFTAVVNSGSAGLAILLVLYMIATAIILLNGLIGIFANAFIVADDEEEEESQGMGTSSGFVNDGCGTSTSQEQEVIPGFSPQEARSILLNVRKNSQEFKKVIADLQRDINYIKKFIP